MKKVFFEFIKHDKEIKVDDFANLVEQNYSNPGLADFISSQREGFFTNRVINSTVTDNGDKIPKDMKLLKAFKFFESNKETLEALQAAASMIIQEDKVEGTLCLSVHPLDFLSASENNHNWRSCHALDGEYRAGNLSYMTDSCTIMCYLKSDKDEKLPKYIPNLELRPNGRYYLDNKIINDHIRDALKHLLYYKRYGEVKNK